MQYVISKDNTRLNIDNLEKIQEFCSVVLEHELQLDKAFTYPGTIFPAAYEYCFQNGYLLVNLYNKT